MMISRLKNGRSYEQYDHCGHDGLTNLSWSGVFKWNRVVFWLGPISFVHQTWNLALSYCCFGEKILTCIFCGFLGHLPFPSVLCVLVFPFRSAGHAASRASSYCGHGPSLKWRRFLLLILKGCHDYRDVSHISDSFIQDEWQRFTGSWRRWGGKSTIQCEWKSINSKLHKRIGRIGIEKK